MTSTESEIESDLGTYDNSSGKKVYTTTCTIYARQASHVLMKVYLYNTTNTYDLPAKRINEQMNERTNELSYE